MSEIYKVKLIETRLKEIVVESLNFRKRLIKVGENVQIQLTWIEANSKFPEHIPKKITKGIIEMALLEFCRKDSVRLNNEIEKTLEKCIDLYKNIRQVHEECHLYLAANINDLPNKDQHRVYLQDRLQEYVQFIQKMELCQ